MNWLNNLYTDFFEYFFDIKGSGFFALLWFAAMLYCGFCSKRTRENIAFPFGIMILAIGNPISAFVLLKVLDDGSFPRIAWTFVGVIVIFYAITEVVFASADRGRRIVAGLLAVALLVVSGQYIYDESLVEKATNPYKVSDDVIRVANHLQNTHRGQQVIVCQDLITEIRQYNPEVILVYGRYAQEDWILDDLLADHDEELWEYFANGIGNKACALVLPADDDLWRKMYDFGWVMDTPLGNYYVYERMDYHAIWHVND